MGTVLKHGWEEQKREYLPKIASGEIRLQAFGVTEPEAGTDTTSLRTTAVRDGDHYVINGRKFYISRVQHSDFMILLARTTPSSKPVTGGGRWDLRSVLCVRSFRRRRWMVRSW
jgi:acyl-CoA dehydrogenase